MGESKNKKIDPGLQYLKGIGFDRIRGKYGLYKRWIKVFGQEKADQLFDQRESIPDASPEFYQFKNSEPEISKSLSEYYDADIIRNACNYIAENREYFGKTILEVGCDVGYMTGFLAKTFPNSKIIAIDRCEEAISIASERLKTFGAENVEYKVADLKDIADQFDTVFCMRTIQENLDFKKALFEGEPIFAQFLSYADLTKDYTNCLISCLKDDGKLCVFERVGHNPLMCGWMMELCSLECAPILETYNEYNCEEAGDINTFQAFVCSKGTKGDIQKAIEYWYDAIEIDPSGKAQLTGWNALVYLHDNAGKLIRGVRILNEENEQVGRFAAFYDKDGEPSIYYLHAAGGSETQMFSYNISLEKEILDQIEKVIDLNVKTGLHYEEIDPNEQLLEGVI